MKIIINIHVKPVIFKRLKMSRTLVFIRCVVLFIVHGTLRLAVATIPLSVVLVCNEGHKLNCGYERRDNPCARLGLSLQRIFITLWSRCLLFIDESVHLSNLYYIHSHKSLYRKRIVVDRDTSPIETRI